MPYVSVATNVPMDAGEAGRVARLVSQCAVQATGKDEQWVMARVEPGQALCYGGTDEPAAYVEFKNVGLDAGACASITDSLCALLSAQCGVPPERVYVEFKSLERRLFGWNGRTLG